MLRGVITTKLVLLHPITLFRCLGFRVALRTLLWAVDRKDHYFINCIFL